MGILDGLRAPAAGLLRTFGSVITLRSYAEVYDVSTGSNIRTETDQVVRALLEDFPARDALGGEKTSDGVRRGDKRVTIAAAALAAAPTTGNVVLISGLIYQIVKVDTQLGTDDAVIYALQVRR